MKKYDFYVGLNDRETKKQEILTSDAIHAIELYTNENWGFATVSLATGLYTHENGEKVRENTIHIEYVDFDGNMKEKMIIAKKHFLEYFHQESILLTATEVETL